MSKNLKIKTATKAQVLAAAKKRGITIEDRSYADFYDVGIMAPEFHNFGCFHESCCCNGYKYSWTSKKEFWAEVLKELESLEIEKCTKEHCAVENAPCEWWDWTDEE